MNEELFRVWIDAYGQAWKAHDADAVGGLFTEDALYYVNPFSEPLCGRVNIMSYWKGLPANQTNVQFQYEVLSVKNLVGIAHWSASFQRISSGKKIHLDGILLADLNADTQCSLFREWWHRNEYE